jgi:rod shape-determining protein MreD
MTRITFCALFGLISLLIQTAVFPRIFPFHLKPDLVLILIVYLGVSQKYGSCGVFSFCIGLLYDVFAGSTFGLHGMILLLVVLIIRSTIDFFNAENPFLLLFLVACGTVLQAGLLIFLGAFAEAGALWQIVLQHLPGQLLANTVAATLLMLAVTYLQRRFPRLVVPGMQRLDERYEG